MIKKIFFISFLTLIMLVSCGENSTGNKNTGKNGDEQTNNENPTDTSDETTSEKNDTEEMISDENNGEETISDEENSDDDNENEDSETHVKPVFNAESSDELETKTEALIVTTNEFAEVFQKFADFHTVTGINTKVVTVENICENAICNNSDTKNDTQKAIKDYVMSVEGLKYLILGGDIEDVPSREVHDKFSITLIADYEDDFYSDLYYADFSNWDLNDNGIYAEDEDVPGLIANVAVGRISVSTVEEAELYFTKIVKHHTAFNTEHTKKSLLLANIATTLSVGSGVDVNAGYYFESAGKTASIIPPDYSIKKLYTQSTPFPGNGTAEPLNNDSEKAAIEEGINLIVHSGHGAPRLLTCEQSNNDNNFTDKMAYNLENETLPFFLSCACEAGQFVTKDSAGEKLMNAPEGGAIVYLGNTTTGLGIAGGSQFIDEMLKNMFASPYSTIGESYLYAHVTMPQSDTFNPTVINVNVPVVNKNSWAWTKKSIVMLGDPMTVFWRDPFEPLTADISADVKEENDQKTVTIPIPFNFEGSDMRIIAGEKLYEIPALHYESIILNLDSSVNSLTVGVKNSDHQYFFETISI